MLLTRIGLVEGDPPSLLNTTKVPDYICIILKLWGCDRTAALMPFFVTGKVSPRRLQLWQLLACSGTSLGRRDKKGVEGWGGGGKGSRTNWHTILYAFGLAACLLLCACQREETAGFDISCKWAVGLPLKLVDGCFMVCRRLSLFLPPRCSQFSLQWFSILAHRCGFQKPTLALKLTDIVDCVAFQLLRICWFSLFFSPTPDFDCCTLGSGLVGPSWVLILSRWASRSFPFPFLESGGLSLINTLVQRCQLQFSSLLPPPGQCWVSR